MLSEIVITGNTLILFTIWVGLLAFIQACRVLWPNYFLERYVSLKQKLPNKTTGRFIAMLWFSFWIYVTLYIMELI
jgi:hypothetical protein